MSGAPAEAGDDGPPFAILYRWVVEPGREDAFRDRWIAATIDLRDAPGALGSCLARDAAGAFLAFARWSSEAARTRAFADRPAPERFPGIVDFSETRLTVDTDLLKGPV